MHRLIGALAIVILCVAPATAGVSGFVEQQSRFLNDPTTGQLLFYINGPLSDESTTFGWWGWAYVTHSYANGYAGFSYQPTSWAQVGIAGGLESGEDAYRVGSFLWLGKDRYSLLVLHETGTTKPWYRVTGKMDVGTFGVGFQSQTLYGNGPRAEIRLRPNNTESLLVTVWSAALWDGNGRSTLLVGVQLGFK